MTEDECFFFVEDWLECRRIGRVLRAKEGKRETLRQPLP
ncbi:hypothetical protein IPA_08025 [Ignicoccus pacificus DSM 13166]|uniref:Uncharacterized protein n=1 Tax=Ignicoccus pacificus DSM 13166 TaxID=940294 RepID=A0A977KBX1_9CREN|nr:hypothetical protein IPA_08025 [Ignicoccus pacificus DSM 13166]